MSIKQQYNWVSVTGVGTVNLAVNKTYETFVDGVSTTSGTAVTNVSNFPAAVADSTGNFVNGVSVSTDSALTNVTVTGSVEGSTSGSFNLSHTHHDDEYLAILTTLNSHMETIKDYMIALNQYTDELVTITNEMREDIQRFRERGESEQLGIYTRGVLDIDSLERASIIHGLKKNNIFNDVVAETNNPTPMP